MTMIIIDVAIGKVRRSFIAFGAMGAHQGHLNPLSGRSIYETCVEPITTGVFRLKKVKK